MGSEGPAVHVGLVGCGRWGSLIRDRLVALGAVVEVVDPDPGRASGAGTGAAPLGVATLAELGSVDAVVVATPATTHAAVLDELVSRNVPVFCEKPLTTDPDDAALVAAALGDHLHVMHIWRYHPGIVALADVVRSGELGAPQVLRTTRANWTSPRIDADAAWTLLPHDLTIAIEVLGGIPAPRSAVADMVDGSIAALWAHCQDPGGPALVVEASTRHSDKRREVRVHCADGVAVLADVDADHIVLARGRDPEPELERRAIPDIEPMAAQLDAFLNHVRGGPAPKSDGAEGVAVVAGVEALRRLALGG